jgi:hypothetical protein
MLAIRLLHFIIVHTGINQYLIDYWSLFIDSFQLYFFLIIIDYFIDPSQLEFIPNSIWPTSIRPEPTWPDLFRPLTTT